MSSWSIVRLGLFLPLFAGVLLLLCTTSTRAQSITLDEWTVYMKVSPCAETLRDWMTVSDHNPPSQPSTAWERARHPQGDRANIFPHTPAGFALAHVRADLLRITGFMASGNTGQLAQYEPYCCKRWTVWSKVDATGTKVFATTPGFGAPGGGFFFQETGPTCCEHAFARAGLSSAGNCGGFQTSTGQVVLFTANGVVAGGTQPIVLEDLIIPPSGAVTTGEAKQIGCFKDPNNPFDLDGFLERSGSNTPQHCVETCRTKGFAYAGVQYGESCLCGNAYGRFGAADNCNMACTGDSSQTCGGINSNMVYSTGLPVAGTGSGGGGAACHDRCQPVAPCPSGEVPLCKDQCGLSRVCRFEPGADRCAICEPQ